MRQKLTSLGPKWLCFWALMILGAVLYFLCPGYSFSGLCTFAAAALIPIYHLLGNIRPRKLRKGAMTMLTILLCVLFAAMSVTCGIIVSSSRGTEDPESEYLIVLGAGVNGTRPSRSLRERIDAAYDYLVSNPEAVAIVSGGQGSGEDITEALCMFNELTAAGIDPERVWMEDKATTTLENLRFSLDLIEERTGTRPAKAAIVSSEYHLHRAGIFAGWLNLEAELVPAKTGIVPLRLNYYLREIFAVWYYSIFGG